MQDDIYFAEKTALLIATENTSLSHQEIIELIDQRKQRFPLSNRDHVFQCSDLYSKEIAWDTFAPLLQGATLVFDPSEEAVDTNTLVETIITREVTVLQATPPLLQVLSEQGQEQGHWSLRLIFYLGEDAPQEATRQFFARTSTELVHLSVSEIAPAELQTTVPSASRQSQKTTLPELMDTTIDSEQARDLLANFANLSDEEVSTLLLKLPQEDGLSNAE